MAILVSITSSFLNRYEIKNVILHMQKEKAKERIILGIDPGTAVLGYGIIREQGNNINLITMGVVKMGAS